MADSCVDRAACPEAGLSPRRSVRRNMVRKPVDGLEVEVPSRMGNKSKCSEGKAKSAERSEQKLESRAESSVDKPSKALKTDISEDPFTGRRVGRQFEGVMMSCSGLLTQIRIHKWAHPFKAPVDAEALGLPDYHTVIKHPIDLGTITERMAKKEFGSDHLRFAADMRRVFDNAMLYNRDGSDIYHMADSLKKQFNFKFAQVLKSWGLPPEEGVADAACPKPARNVSRVPKVGNSGPKIVGKAPRSRPGLEFKPNGKAACSAPAEKREPAKKRAKPRASASPRKRAKRAQRRSRSEDSESEMEKESEEKSGYTTEDSSSEDEGAYESESDEEAPAMRSAPRVLKDWQMKALVQGVGELPGDMLGGMLQLINECMPGLVEFGQEVEIDLEDLDDACRYRVYEYVQQCQVALACAKATARASAQSDYVEDETSDEVEYNSDFGLPYQSELSSPSDSGKSLDLPETWEVEEDFSKPSALQKPQTLQVLDPKTLAVTGPPSPFLGHKNSHENRAWMETYSLQSPSVYNDGRSVKDDDDDTCVDKDSFAGLEYLNLSFNGRLEMAA